MQKQRYYLHQRVLRETIILSHEPSSMTSKEYWQHFFSILFVFLEKISRFWDGYGRAMSERGSVFRHGTLRWAYASRSKQPFLPTAVHPQQIWQSAPIVRPRPITDNGSPPEPPLRRPNWVLHTEPQSGPRGGLLRVDEHTWYDMSAFIQNDSLLWRPYRPLKNVLTFITNLHTVMFLFSWRNVDLFKD